VRGSGHGDGCYLTSGKAWSVLWHECLLLQHSSRTLSLCLPLQGCMLPMGVTSENVAAKYGVTRK
jgi:hypothetical protein